MMFERFERTTKEKADILIREIYDALERGTQHFSKDGTPLSTAKEIVDALLRDKTIMFRPKGLGYDVELNANDD